MSTAARGQIVGGALLVALLVCPFVGCALARSGSIGQNCSSDAQCNDDSPCTNEACSADGLCEFTPVDASASLVQIPFDCQNLWCRDGRIVGLPDDSDVPTNSCVDASCNAGQLTEVPRADGTPCELGSGTGSCEGGECVVSCDPNNAATQCDDANGCTIDSCRDGTCAHDKLDNEQAPGTTQVVGDCKLVLCVQGVAQPLADNNDLPVDNNPCTEDLCNNGVPSNPNLPPDTECGDGLACNQSGQCVGCDEPIDCGGNNNDCSTITCTNGVCGVQNAPAGTPLPPGQQTPNDCIELRCDGNGNATPVAEANGTMCDDGVYCNGGDTCTGGNCSIHTGDPCPGPDGDIDCSESCNEQGMDCTANDPFGSACNDGIPPSNDTCSMNGACIGACGQEPPAPGGGCPSPCDDCTGNVCTINCVGNNACDGDGTITCPPGFACELVCSGSNACKQVTLMCPDIYPCNTQCAGSNGCVDLTVECSPAGTCNLSCNNDSNVCKNAVVNCGDNDCAATCQSSTPIVNCSMSSMCACGSC